MVLAEITALIALFKGIRSTYDWGREVLSIEWKNEYRKYVDYLEEVERAVTPYENSKRSKISNKGGLKLLEGELKEAWSFVDEWMKKTGLEKQLTSDAFRKKLQTSRATIAQNLQLFWFQLFGTEQGECILLKKQHIQYIHHLYIRIVTNICCIQATQRTDKAAKRTARQPYNENRSPMGGGKVRPADHEGNHGKPQLRKPLESELKEQEKSRYKTWLVYNVTKWTDSWDTYKNLEDPTLFGRSRLDLAEKETLFGEHMNMIREHCLSDYRRLLKSDIKWHSSNYLTSWSDAEGYLKRRPMFYRVPETVREEEWRKHVDWMLERVDKILEARGENNRDVLEQVDKILKAREARGENNRCVSEQVDKMLKALRVLQEKEKQQESFGVRPVLLRPVLVGKQKKWFCNVKCLLSVYNND